MQLQAATGNLRVKMVALLFQHFCAYQQFKVVEHNEGIKTALSIFKTIHFYLNIFIILAFYILFLVLIVKTFSL